MSALFPGIGEKEMAMLESEEITIAGDGGAGLTATLVRPKGGHRAVALFAHELDSSGGGAATIMASALAGLGVATLHFEGTGSGIGAALRHLGETFAAPKILIGHGAAGGAVLATAPGIAEAVAVVLVNAPAPAEALSALRGMRKALLVMHSPVDQTVGIENARRIFETAFHPKSFVSLDTSDHRLGRPEDAAFAADVAAAWIGRYLEKGDAARARAWGAPVAARGSVVVTESGAGRYAQLVSIGGRHVLRADEPVKLGGDDLGPAPYDLLLAGLGACTTMTIRMYAERKGIPLERVAVTLRHKKRPVEDLPEAATASGKVDWISREIEILGNIDPATRQRMLEIADKCPVHRTLHSEVLIESRLAE